MANLIDMAAKKAQSASRAFVYWALSDEARRIEARANSSNLRRAVYNNDLRTIFPSWDKGSDEKLLSPDCTAKQIIDKVATNIFPNKTSFSLKDEKANALLQDIIFKTRFDKKAGKMVREAAMQGYCALRSVWLDSISEWLIEVKPFEHLEIVQNTQTPEIIEAIYVCYPFTANGLRYWYREKWTAEEYWVWMPVVETTPNKRPVFLDTDRDIKKEANTFGEIPITLVAHEYDEEKIGLPIIKDDDIELVRCLIRIRNKRHYAHLEHMDPTLVTINNENDVPIRRGVGAVIALKGDETNTPSAELLAMNGLPESVKDELVDNVTILYKNAGLTPPSLEDVVKTGADTSGIALRIRDKDELAIETLRDRAYGPAVIQHLGMLLRLGKKTSKLPAYSAISFENAETTDIQIVYPDPFPLTPDEILSHLDVLERSHLSPKQKAEQEAQLFKIDDPDEIAEMERRWEEAEANKQPGMLDPVNDGTV
jgi:Phage portal protein, SPP1 Gp6-like